MAKRKRKSVRGGAPNRTGRVNRTTVAKKGKQMTHLFLPIQKGVQNKMVRRENQLNGA